MPERRRRHLLLQPRDWPKFLESSCGRRVQENRERNQTMRFWQVQSADVPEDIQRAFSYLGGFDSQTSATTIKVQMLQICVVSAQTPQCRNIVNYRFAWWDLTRRVSRAVMAQNCCAVVVFHNSGHVFFSCSPRPCEKGRSRRAFPAYGVHRFLLETFLVLVVGGHTEHISAACVCQMLMTMSALRAASSDVFSFTIHLVLFERPAVYCRC